MISSLRQRSLCLFNSDQSEVKIEPWLTTADLQFHADVRSLYSPSNINPIQSIQSDYLPAWISYLWPLVFHGKNVWAIDHPTSRELLTLKLILKYDLLIWNIFYRSTSSSSSASASSMIYPKVLILAPDWSTCEAIDQHLKKSRGNLSKKINISCVYEGQKIVTEMYNELQNDDCDILISTPTIIGDLIEKRLIHFEQLQLIVYDQIDLLVQTIDPMNQLVDHLHLHSTKDQTIQQVFLSHTFTQSCEDFLRRSTKIYSYLSSSMLETFAYRRGLIYCEPCRNWFDRKQIIKDTLELARNCQKKVVICAHQMRRLTTMQNILNDLSIQSILLHSQLTSSEIDQSILEWQSIDDRAMILLIQDEILSEISIENSDILIHLDVQRLLWYYLFNQRLKLFNKHFSQTNSSMKICELNSLKSIEKFYLDHRSNNVPLMVILWPGDCAQVTYELIDYLNRCQVSIHPLIERLAKNNCNQSIQAKLNVEFCPTLKCFGQCSNEMKLKRCPYRHQFHLDVDSIEEKTTEDVSSLLSKSFELFLPRHGEVELRVTNVTDGNRLWAQILRSRNDVEENLRKIFDYERFDLELRQGFDRVQHRPLSEIVLGEIYFYRDENDRIHRVYVHDHEQNFFDIRRSDAILNRLSKISNVHSNEEIEKSSTMEIPKEKSPDFIVSSSSTNVDRPPLTVFSLDTGITFTLKSNEHLYPIEPTTLKQYPPLAVEIILCHIYPLDKINMTFTPFTIETLRSRTLNEVFMGRIQLATRSCFWIDPLVKPVRLASLKRIVYDKPIRKQLILARLVDSNDDHLVQLEKLAADAQLKETAAVEPTAVVTKEEEEEEEKTSTSFKPFLNSRGQLIINPLGRSKEFFSRHHHDEASTMLPVGRLATVAPPIESTTETKKKIETEVEESSHNDDDQMMFIFGPKLFSQLRQIKDMEDEQRRQTDFPVQRTRHRYSRPAPTDENKSNSNEQSFPPNMSRYEPFVGERGSLTQEQIDYKQTQRKTRLFWEQTSRDIYLTVGFYNVDSTQTRVEFNRNSIYCRTKIRTYDRFVRIHLAEEILPEKCSFQVRRSNILITLRKATEGQSWTKLNDRPIEPRPDFFTIDYGSDDESETDKRRRTVNRQWEEIRAEKRRPNRPDDEEKFLLDDEADDDQHQISANAEQNNSQDLTETSSDCHSTDSDDCYYEDQVPANHIPKGYDDADFDHRFYGNQLRT